MISLALDGPERLTKVILAMIEAMIATFYTNQKVVIHVHALYRDKDSILVAFVEFPNHPGMRISFGSGASQHDARMKMELLAPLNIFICKDGTVGIACPFTHPGDAHAITDPRECATCGKTGCAECMRKPDPQEYDGWQCVKCRYEDIPNSQR